MKTMSNRQWRTEHMQRDYLLRDGGELALKSTVVRATLEKG
jgi:hypothetical protein